MQVPEPTYDGYGLDARGLSGDAAAAAFPLGGIGTGNVSLGARGEFRDWEIFNRPAKGNTLPYTFFALRAAVCGRAPLTRVLESRLRPPHERWNGYEPGAVAGLPRFDESRFRGEYPFVWIEFVDDELPVSVSLEAFRPLIPLDSVESALPVAIMRYRVINTSERPAEVTVVGSLFNPLSFMGQHPANPFPTYGGTPSVDYVDDGVLRGLSLSSSIPDDDPRHGTLALSTVGRTITVKPNWPASPYGIADLWNDLCDDGRLAETAATDTPYSKLPEPHEDMNAARDPFGTAEKERAKMLRVGSLGVMDAIAPGDERSFEFTLTWHFPNRPKQWLGVGMVRDPRHAKEIDRNFYATRFRDAWNVAQHVHDKLPELERLTRRFHDALYGSSLPCEVIDALSANIVVLRSTTCFRIEDGSFAAWEGVADQEGACPGSCTHVWNYAQTGAFLFPDLERSMRRIEFLRETDPDGRMNFRTNFGRTPLWRTSGPQVAEQWKRAAADGQLGTIVRLYREWKFSGDEPFLRDMWPNAVRALEFAFEHWDRDGDLVLEAPQHTTFDIELHGANPLTSSLFYVALRAAAEMADHLGDTESARRYHGAAVRGSATMDALLWNGEYYVQHLPDKDAYPHQFGVGCLSDQLLGQLYAHIVGLGYVLPRDHVRQAIASVHRYNFHQTLHGHENTMRTYALEDEGGVVVCSWPKGGRPRRPFVYADEVWSGTEYQVAAHLIWEGMVEQGREIVRAVRARHDGFRRSPWNETECGYHYARSLASWALLLAYSGFHYDGVTNAIEFAPATEEERFECFFTTGSGWGTFRQDGGGAQLHLQYGSLMLSSFTVRVASGHRVCGAFIRGEEVSTTIESSGLLTTVTFDAVRLAEDDEIEVSYY